MWKIAPIAIALVIVVLTGTGCPTDKTPPQVVTEFTATGGDAQVVLTWKNPTDSDFNGVKILRKEGSAPTSTTDGTVIFDANATTFTNTGLTNGVTYYFAAFAFDKAGNFSAAAQSGATPTSPTAHGDILGEFDNVG